MKYLKVFTDFVADMKELGEAERGRLFTAMLEYAETGEEPALRGNERFVWGTAKKNIDNQRDSYEKRCEINRQNITNRYESLRTVTNSYESKQDKDKDKDKDKEKNKKTIKRFTPPTVDEVRAYCTERGNNVDPQTFVDFYEAKGWMVGSNHMKDWRACVRTWEKNRVDRGRGKQNPALKYEQKPISKTDFDALVVDLGEA